MDDIQPLDLYFTRPTKGFGKLVDVVQRLFYGDSHGVHTGIVITRNILDLPQLLPNTLYLMESTENDYGSEVPDVVTNRIKNGFQIRKLDEVARVAKLCGCSTFICKLKRNPHNNPVLVQFVKNEVMKVYDTYHSYEYQKNIAHFLAPVLFCCIPIRLEFGKKNTIFCSQLVCILYQKLFIINKLYPNGNEISPHTLLSDKSIFHEPFEI
jgi:hypothetical protein